MENVETMMEIGSQSQTLIMDLQYAYLILNHHFQKEIIYIFKTRHCAHQAQFRRPLHHPVTCITLAENLIYFEINLSRVVVVYKRKKAGTMTDSKWYNTHVLIP